MVWGQFWVLVILRHDFHINTIKIIFWSQSKNGSIIISSDRSSCSHSAWHAILLLESPCTSVRYRKVSHHIYMHHIYISRSRITDMCIMDTCIRVKGRIINTCIIHVYHTHMHYDSGSRIIDVCIIHTCIIHTCIRIKDHINMHYGYMHHANMHPGYMHHGHMQHGH